MNMKRKTFKLYILLTICSLLAVLLGFLIDREVECAPAVPPRPTQPVAADVTLMRSCFIQATKTLTYNQSNKHVTYDTMFLGRLEVALRLFDSAQAASGLYYPEEPTRDAPYRYSPLGGEK